MHPEQSGLNNCTYVGVLPGMCTKTAAMYAVRFGSASDRLQGTSMAAPHVAGVAALIISKTGAKRMSPARVAASLAASATPKPCPKVNKVWYPGGSNSRSYGATCRKYSSTRNSFFGYGLVSAHRAVNKGYPPLKGK